MTLKTLFIVLVSLTNIGCYGGFGCLYQKKMIKIAKREILKKRFKAAGIGTEILTQMQILEHFAEQEFYVNSFVEQKLNTIFTFYWKTLAAQMQENMTKKDDFESKKDEFWNNYHELKPIILKTLLDDEPITTTS